MIKEIKAILLALAITAAFGNCKTPQPFVSNAPGGGSGGSGPAGWADVPTSVSLDSSLASSVAFNRQYLIARSAGDHRLYSNSSDSKTWSGWNSIPDDGSTDLSPCTASFAGELYVFARNSRDHSVYALRSDGKSWTKWQPLTVRGTTASGTTNVSPAALGYGGYLYVFRVGDKDSSLYFNRYNTATWFPSWLRVPGSSKFLISPTPLLYHKTLFLFAGAYPNDHPSYTTFNGKTWTTWKEIPGNFVTHIPTAAATDGEKIYLFARSATDNALYSTEFDGTNWTGWKAFAGQTTGLSAITAQMFQSKIWLYRKARQQSGVSGTAFTTDAAMRKHITNEQAKNSFIVSKDSPPGLVTGVGASPPDPDEQAFFSRVRSYTPKDSILLGPGASFDLPVAIPQAVTVIAVVDAGTATTAPRLVLRDQSSVLAEGTALKTGAGGYAVSAKTKIAAPGTITVSLQNPGGDKMVVRLAVETLQ